MEVSSALLMLFGYFTLCEANFNLFMNDTEARRLLGIEGELYYVRDGNINDYALRFNMTVKTEIDRIFFNWQNLRRPSSMVMLYQLSVVSSNTKALYHPQPSIPNEGVVPTKLEVFSVRMACTGHVIAEVDVLMQLNVTMNSASNVTVLNIHRRKTCLKDAKLAREPPPGSRDSYSVLRTEDGEDPTEKEPVTSTNIFYIAVGSACGLILLIALIVAIYYVRSSKSSSGHGERLSDTSSARTLTQKYQRPDTTTPCGLSRFNPHFPEIVSDYASESSSARGMPHEYLRVDSNSNGGVPRRPMSPINELSPESVTGMLADIQIDRSKLTLNEVLIEGTFGCMYHGLMHIEDDVPVVVKTVTEAARPDQTAVILRDGCLLKGLIHPNVHGIMAVCLPSEKSSPVLVYPHASESNLKKFLQRCKLSEMHQPLNTQQIVFMAIQVTRGVQFLHRKRIVHKDIAARNCVVDHQFNVKVTDAALARDFFPNDYHCLGDNENRPIKWLALESLMERRFTPASDVWAFGVLIWELLTLALQPYADVDPFEMAGYLKEGFRIAQPLNCPDEIFAVMACCWALNPEERPKFAQLQVCLQDFYSALGNFV